MGTVFLIDSLNTVKKRSANKFLMDGTITKHVPATLAKTSVNDHSAPLTGGKKNIKPENASKRLGRAEQDSLHIPAIRSRDPLRMKCPEVNEKLLQLDKVESEAIERANDLIEAEGIIDDAPQAVVSYHPLTGKVAGPPEFVGAYNGLTEKLQEYEKLIRESGPLVKTYISTDQEAIVTVKHQDKGSQERRDYEAIARQGTKEALADELLSTVDYQSCFLHYRWEEFKQCMDYFYPFMGSLSQRQDKNEVLKACTLMQGTVFGICFIFSSNG